MYRVRENGVSIYLAVMLVSALLGIALGASTLLLSELSGLRGTGHSVLALYATDAGVEHVLYLDQKTCKDDLDRVGCLIAAIDLLGTQTLGNGAQYDVTIESPGGSCPASLYCVKSVGTYKEARRAVRVAR